MKELPNEWIERCGATQLLNAPVSEASAKDRFEALRALLAQG